MQATAIRWRTPRERQPGEHFVEGLRCLACVVTRKIFTAAAYLAFGRDTKLSLGNFEVERDWGWAPEYVQAISLMLEQPAPEDYIIATGQSHTLTQFVEAAFNLIGKDWQEYVTIDQHLSPPY